MLILHENTEAAKKLQNFEMIKYKLIKYIFFNKAMKGQIILVMQFRLNNEYIINLLKVIN